MDPVRDVMNCLFSKKLAALQNHLPLQMTERQMNVMAVYDVVCDVTFVVNLEIILVHVFLIYVVSHRYVYKMLLLYS
jgi:hypothetical protein